MCQHPGVTVTRVEAYGLTPDDIMSARYWCQDVVGNPDEVDDAPDEDVMRFLARHYGGGIAQFLDDGRPVEVTR